MGSIGQTERAAGVKVCETQTGSWVEDVDSDLLQEQTQSICEELQRRGARTTLALARHLGFEKSSAINPLMCLLLEKNVVVRVSDIPPIWYLSPTFPVSPHLGSSQFPPSSQPHSPLNLGVPPSVPRLFQCTPILPAPIPAPFSPPGPVNSALAPVEPSTASPMPAPGPAPNLISTPASTIPIPALFATPSATLGPTSSVERTVPTSASEISSPIVTRTVPPAPAAAPTFISTCVSPIPAPTATPAPSPSPTAISTPASLTAAPAVTFLEHAIPVPRVEYEEETEDEVEEEIAIEEELAVVKKPPKTHLPAITFLEHLIPETTLENKLSLFPDNPPDIKPHVLVPIPTSKEHVSAIPTPPLGVGQGHKHDQHRGYRQRARRRKKESDQSSRYFQLNRGSNTSNKKRKASYGDPLTELQIRILQELRAIGPTKTFDLSKRVGLVTCRDVNPSLFDLKRKNLVVRTRKTPVVWQLSEPVLLETEPEGDQGDQRSSDSDESW